MSKKELCQLLEIKPKYCAFCPGIYSFPFEDSRTYHDSKDEDLLNGNEYFLEDEFYPDFYEPDNFVKLLYLKSQKFDTVPKFHTVLYEYRWSETQQELIEELINDIKAVVSPINVDFLKHQAQQVNWRY